jgi:hypothetical protein
MSERDDEMIAHHEAGHAVAMWLLGLGVEHASIEPAFGVQGHASPRFESVEETDADDWTRRFIVEEEAMFLHAGDVAARLVRPEVDVRQAAIDHEVIHAAMSRVERDPAVQAAWCIHAWQRAHALLARPLHRPLVAGLAGQLLAHRSLPGDEVERYLRRAQERLRYDPRIPNVVLLPEYPEVGSPWHRPSPAATAELGQQSRKPSAVPATIAGLSARIDRRPVAAALGGLSARARASLHRAGIQTVADLEESGALTLRVVRGCGPKTVAEIAEAVAQAGVEWEGPETELRVRRRIGRNGQP